jgi:hypothetical protein
LKNRGENIRAISSAGSEHLPYKQRVGGSNPSSPTRKKDVSFGILFFVFIEFGNVGLLKDKEAVSWRNNLLST